jgi:hypothetical protein
VSGAGEDLGDQCRARRVLPRGQLVDALPVFGGQDDVADRAVGYADPLGTPARLGCLVAMAVDGGHHDLGREALLLACLSGEPLLAVQRDVDADADRGLAV